MTCVSSTAFSININGEFHGFFKGCRGIRQGDPMSPYLFTLVMEVLLLMINRLIQNEGTFEFNPGCREHRITNLCFADDLILFSHGDYNSVKIIRDSLEEFKRCSGLIPSIPKM